MSWCRQSRTDEHRVAKPARGTVTPIGRARDGARDVAMLVVFVRASRARDCALALERAGFSDVAGPFVGASEVPGQRSGFTTAPALLALSKARERHAFGNVVIDVTARDVVRAGARVKLTPSELELLVALARAGGQVVDASTLQRLVCGAPHENGDTHVLRMHIVQLRRKLEDDRKRPRHLLTVWGRGYRLAEVRMVDEAG